MSSKCRASALLFGAFTAAVIFMGIMSPEDQIGAKFPPCGYGRVCQGGIRVNAGESKDKWKTHLASFLRREESGGYNVTYDWKDYFGGCQNLSMFIARPELAAAIQTFGITPEDRKHYYETLDEKALVGFEQFGNIQKVLKTKQGPIHLKYYDGVSEDQFDQFWRYVRKMENDYLRHQGFQYYRDGRLMIDYTAVIETHKSFMTEAARAFARQAIKEKQNLGQLIHGIMAFVQTIPYEIPPVFDKERYLEGLRPPLETLVRGNGDCDTKAVLFSTIVNNLKGMNVVIVVIPGHAFNGLVGGHKRLPKDTVIQYQGRDILLVDLTSDYDFYQAGCLHEGDKQNLRHRQPKIYGFKGD